MPASVASLPQAHGGGALTLLMAAPERCLDLRSEARDWPSWDLTPRQLCDLEMLLNGSFSPLTGFLGEQDFKSVCNHMRLVDGTLWPLPISLDVSQELGDSLALGDRLALRDPEGVMVTSLVVESLFSIDREAKAEAVYGTLDRHHPGVRHLFERVNNVGVGGRLEGVEAPRHYDYGSLRMGPAEVRRRFEALGWRRVVAFQTRNPLHRAHVEMTLRAARELQANLLIHPVVGMTKPGDVDHYTRVRCYLKVLERYPFQSAMLALLPLAMRMGGPREALLHAIIRKNYGCSHLIVGRDHAGPGSDSSGRPFYGPYEAQDLVRKHEQELGIGVVPFRQMVYVEDRDAYMPVDQVPEGCRSLSISGTELRDRLARGADLPTWFTFPEVSKELRRTYRPRTKQGFTVFFTGLSGAGKSTVANVLQVKLLELGDRPITLLDGDIVRKNLSSELGFSAEHRSLNIQRIGFVANEITKNGGIAICAPIAPYEEDRRRVRELVETGGGFILVHVSTPLEICEQRDRKGLYAKARAGLIDAFTGISDPYEEPERAEVVLDTSNLTPLQAAQKVLLFLEHEGYIGDVDRAL